MLTSFDTASNDASVSSSLATIFRGKLCDTLLRNRSTITFDKGATIYDAGDKGRTFFFVKRGVVKVGTVTGDGHEIIYDLRKEGDVVGELCACESVRRDRAVAPEPTEVMAVPFDEILDALQKNRASNRFWKSSAALSRVRTIKPICCPLAIRSIGSSRCC